MPAMTPADEMKEVSSSQGKVESFSATGRPEISAEELVTANRVNWAVSFVQLITGVVILVLTDEDEEFPWFSIFPGSDEDQAGEARFTGPRPDEIWEFNPGYLSGVFLLLSWLDHFLVATVFRSVYEDGLRKNRNVFRWIEYSVSASLMHVLIALLSGVQSVNLLVQIFGNVATCMLFGLAFEVENGARPLKDVNWLSFYLGWIPYMFAWATIFAYFFYAVDNSDDVPDWVWAIIFVIFIINMAFPIATALQWRGVGKFKNYVYGEITFIIVSMVSKQLLAWINFGGSQG
uniref:Uncharacterized protein n=1 Tax=Pinguiococcus pyrenoidosus TaxID=172671 RepID=A0A7R9U8P9_9STRA